jgi:hypothetical protein
MASVAGAAASMCSRLQQRGVQNRGESTAMWNRAGSGGIRGDTGREARAAGGTRTAHIAHR